MRKKDVKTRNVRIVAQNLNKYEIWKDIKKARKKLFVPAARKRFAIMNIINNI